MVQCVSTVFEHSRVVSSTHKNVRALDCVSCSKIFLRAGNNPVVLKNSTEHAEPLFITLTMHFLTKRKHSKHKVNTYFAKLYSAVLLHSPRKIISTVVKTRYKIIENCYR